MCIQGDSLKCVHSLFVSKDVLSNWSENSFLTYYQTLDFIKFDRLIDCFVFNDSIESRNQNPRPYRESDMFS